MLADEPTGSLDNKTADMIFDLLVSIVRETKSSLIIVTHDRELAKKCDKVMNMVSGHLE